MSDDSGYWLLVSISLILAGFIGILIGFNVEAFSFLIPVGIMVAFFGGVLLVIILLISFSGGSSGL